MQNNLPVWGLAMVACAPLLAIAQPGDTAPSKQSPQLSYRSAFADYKPYKDASLVSWRELNAMVAGARGGTSGHAEHSVGDMKGTEMSVPSAAPASAAMRMKPMHDGHPKTGGKP
jgi:hypothetical protein